MNTDSSQARAAFAAFAAALMADTIRNEANKHNPNPADLAIVWADVPEKYQYISWEFSSDLVLVHTADPIRNTDGSLSSAPNSTTARYAGVVPDGAENRGVALRRLTEVAAEAYGRDLGSVSWVLFRRPRGSGTLSVGSGSTFTRLTEEQKSAIWTGADPKWVCLVFSPESGVWRFFSEIPKRENDKWTYGPKAEYVSLRVVNAAIRSGTTAEARDAVLAELVKAQPGLPWIILRAGDPRTASIESAASKLPSATPAPAPARTLTEFFDRLDAEGYSSRVNFVTRRPTGHLDLWELSPRRCGDPVLQWGSVVGSHAGSAPASWLSDSALAANHPSPAARPMESLRKRGSTNIPQWARYAIYVPGVVALGVDLRFRLSRLWFAEKLDGIRKAKSSGRYYPDFGDGKGGRVPMPPNSDAIWKRAGMDRVRLGAGSDLPRIVDLQTGEVISGLSLVIRDGEAKGRYALPPSGNQKLPTVVMPVTAGKDLPDWVKPWYSPRSDSGALRFGTAYRTISVSATEVHFLGSDGYRCFERRAGINTRLAGSISADEAIAEAARGTKPS